MWKLQGRRYGRKGGEIRPATTQKLKCLSTETLPPRHILSNMIVATKGFTQGHFPTSIQIFNLQHTKLSPLPHNFLYLEGRGRFPGGKRRCNLANSNLLSVSSFLRLMHICLKLLLLMDISILPTLCDACFTFALVHTQKKKSWKLILCRKKSWLHHAKIYDTKI